jgi:hypothetical protein
MESGSTIVFSGLAGVHSQQAPSFSRWFARVKTADPDMFAADLRLGVSPLPVKLEINGVHGILENRAVILERVRSRCHE